MHGRVHDACNRWQVICNKAHERWAIKKIAMAHRTGLVAIGEPSVIIAVSSAHRKEALEVAHAHVLAVMVTCCAYAEAWLLKAFAS